jgi:hypothetical protein
VDGVPARDVLAEHVGTAELAEHTAARGHVQAGHAGSRVRGDVCAQVQAQQPEHARCPSTELSIGPGEQGTHAGHGIPAVQRVETAGDIAEFGGQGR